MIDFRYHLVSIVAVFLALGLGLLVGATALQPTALGGLIRLSQQERQQIASALAANRQLSRQIDSNDQFAQAGAAVSGHVQLQNKFFDTSPSTEQQLSQLAQQFAPAGTSLRGSPVAQASQAIAGAILTKDGPGQPVAGQRDAASVALLSGFGAGGFLNVTGHPDARATLAVVILPDSPQSTSIADPQSQRLVTLAQQANLTGQGTVVAGSVAGSGPGSAIDVMRNGGRAGHLSSVDNADHAIGQIVVAQALYEQLRGVSGSYGTGAGATAPGPSPAPTPASLQPAPGQPSRPAVRAGKS